MGNFRGLMMVAAALVAAALPKYVPPSADGTCPVGYSLVAMNHPQRVVCRLNDDQTTSETYLSGD
jgi:hypothetical protein